jgi:hypothetical protein
LTIEIHQPELEAIIQRRMESGLFQSVEDVLLAALKSSSIPEQPAIAPNQSFVELFEPLRGMFADGELDFSRNLSTGRPVELS